VFTELFVESECNIKDENSEKAAQCDGTTIDVFSSIQSSS